MSVLLALLPVLLFAIELRLLDSFKLVHVSAVVASIAWGVAAALVCLGLHQWLLALAIIDIPTAGRYVAPVTEETLKAVFVAILIARGRIGFSVDAAIHGFAVGAGFALVENGFYLLTLSVGSPVLWVVRGFGTAVLHGSTTAIFALISRPLADSRRRNLAVAFLPGWLAAMLIHATFNQALIAPLAATITLLIVMPALVLIVFQRSERATRKWIGAGMDLDVDLLQMLRSGVFLGTPFGLYLLQLRERFPGPTVVDMFCLATRVGIIGAGESAAAGARSWARCTGGRRSSCEPGGDHVPESINRSCRTSGTQAAADEHASRRLAPASPRSARSAQRFLAQGGPPLYGARPATGPIARENAHSRSLARTWSAPGFGRNPSAGCP